MLYHFLHAVALREAKDYFFPDEEQSPVDYKEEFNTILVEVNATYTLHSII